MYRLGATISALHTYCIGLLKDMDNPQQKSYLAIDLKSFYASVECVDRGLDPLSTNLVVADVSRTQKTICLAVSPSLKRYGVGGRARLFEVVQRMHEVNGERAAKAGGHLTGRSYDDNVLSNDATKAVDYIAATPRMARYIEVSTQIYGVYLKYIAPEDIHVYSIDEVFIDATPYLKSYKMTPHQLVMTIVRDVLRTTGITATAGIGTNLYLAKVAMDVVAKHIPADKDGVRIAELDELSYRRKLWNYQPITKFWRVGRGTAAQLAQYGISTMGQLARFSINNENVLFKQFGVNAELLIDHAWGWEPCTISEVKAYKPLTNSMSTGQVLQCPYTFDKGRVVVQEMAYQMALDLVAKRMVTCQIVLTIGYDSTSLDDKRVREQYTGEVITDWYGRPVPKYAHGTCNMHRYNSSGQWITQAVKEIYDRVVNPMLMVRRISLVANKIIDEDKAKNQKHVRQLDLFANEDAILAQEAAEQAMLDKERRLQEAMIAIKKQYGKNAVLKGINFEEGATGIQRNEQIGGHKA